MRCVSNAMAARSIASKPDPWPMQTQRRTCAGRSSNVMSPASSSAREPRAAIFGCAGLALSNAEREFFRAVNPLGFILFQRNCADPEQVRALVAALRDCVGTDDAPILIDQEGGRVARLKPPHWRNYPAAAALAATAAPREASFLVARLIADDLSTLGITVDCAPVLD